MPFEILEIKHQPDENLINLLEANIIGTPGDSMLYQHRDVREKVTGLADPVFCNVSIRDKLYGSITFCGRSVRNLDKVQRAFYIRYFTFLDEFRSNAQMNRRGSGSIIRREVHQLMNGEGLNLGDGDLLLYAYADPENVRSWRLIEEFGFKHVGHFHTIPFSRLKPRKSANIEVLQKEQRELFMPELNHHYKDHQLVSFENLRNKGDYFVVRENRKVVCGVQGIYDRWKILDLPGWGGKMMMHVVPKIPVIKKLFNPDYRFVFLEAIYCKPGYENRLPSLFESVLAHYNANSGIICMDPGSGLYPRIQQMPLGITHKIMGEKKIKIVVKTSNANMIVKDKPFFISGYDVL